MIPYADITEADDRRWTSRLLDRLTAADPPYDELDALLEALQTLSDPRSVDPLEAIVRDTARPDRIRQAASWVLTGMDYLVPDVPEETLRRWWREGDAVLRCHALRSMDAFACPDIVLAVASDPAHPLQAEALGRLEFHFDRPDYETIKINALAHPDPAVRETAATVLLWDEPVRAEGPLLDATRDPVAEVAAAACHTLQYYPSLRTAAWLHGLLGHPAETVRRGAEESFRDIRNGFLFGLHSRDRHVARHVRRWLEPVWDLLAYTDAELQPGDGHAGTTPPREPEAAVPLARLLEMLGDPDASPKELQEALWRTAWRGHAAERGRLRGVLLGHADPLVRAEAAAAFEAWQDADGLLALVADPDFFVRKSAMHHLGQLPPTPGVADRAWEHLHRPDALGVHATETLDTFVRHADPAVAIRRLGWITGDHGWREGVRVAAVCHLERAAAKEPITQLAGLLREPPGVTWALHTALLEAIASLGLPRPHLGSLWEVDNLFVQEAIAGMAA
jgi:HEAT repeat protein